MALPSFPRSLSVLALVALAGCNTQGPRTPRLAEAPMCAIHAVSFAINPVTAIALVSERSDPNASHGGNHGFSRFRGIGAPRGNTTVASTIDVYSFNEAWTRNTAGSVIVRGQAHPARRPVAGDTQGSAWTINTQDAAGLWSPAIGMGSANPGEEIDTPVAGALTGPQLMPVGLATPEVFGCVGARSEDGAVRTTWLAQVVPANVAAQTPSRVFPIQDVLNGDDRFVRNPSVPLGGIGPNVPPTPRINNRPGHPIREGSVQCAMTQLDDEVSTRELHMLAVRNGVLYHSMANGFSTATRSTGLTFNRFNTISPWGDVGSVLGGNFGIISDATIVAWPRAVHVFFVAESGGRHKLWHTARFSSDGAWRPAVDVLNTVQASTHGRLEAFRVAAGNCPMPEDTSKTELVYTTWRGDDEIKVGRIVSTPRLWYPGYQSAYSPLSDLSHLIGRTSDTSRQTATHSMTIGARPFRDTDRAP